MKTNKTKFDVRIRLYEVDDTKQYSNPYPMEKVSIPLHEIYDNFDSADNFLRSTLEQVMPTQKYIEPNFTHYIHAYVTRPEFEFENVPVFRYGRSFMNLEDAKAFVDKYINLVLSLKELQNAWKSKRNIYGR